MMRKRVVVVKPVRFSIFIAICILMVLSLIGMILNFDRAYSTTYATYEYIEVIEGDTIWAIASKINYKNDDIRKVVDNIREINKLHSYNIHPGDIIKIPIKKIDL